MELFGKIFTKYDWGLKLQEFLYSLQSGKKQTRQTPPLSSLKPNLFNSSALRPILDAVLCWGMPELFHIAQLRSTYKTIFMRARTSRAERLWKACCTPQHGFSTAFKMKRRSVDVIFLCKLEKFEKYFPVNWGIIIEYIHKHYIK